MADAFTPGLRFDIDIDDAAGVVKETTAAAEAESLLVCEYCGEDGGGPLVEAPWWCSVLCRECMDVERSLPEDAGGWTEVLVLMLVERSSCLSMHTTTPLSEARAEATLHHDAPIPSSYSPP
uniref:ZZ-type domain-containing protein n=1 Tax=Mycena chlorophos TaxID=658473 RepID=A0ABQ0MB48_MYCCL|nr:predicted protein [Mycena chlorophos]